MGTRAIQVPKLGIYPMVPTMPPWLGLTQGKIWHVRPGWASASDDNSGRQPHSAFKSIAAALDAAVENRNDVIKVYGEGNAANLCTDYQTESLVWNKDMVHLVGINSGVSMSPRSRIAPISTYAAAAPTMQVTANGCYFANLSIWMGVTDVTPLGALVVTGSRSRFDNCHILGMGQATNDVAGAYSLKLEGAEECEFWNCVIGSDRIALGAALNSQILVAAAVKNCRFFGGEVRLYTAHATNTLFLRAAAGSLDGVLEFRNMPFLNSVHRSGGTGLTYACSIASDAGGDVVFVGGEAGSMATDVNATDAGNVYGVGGVATAGTFGLANALTK